MLETEDGEALDRTDGWIGCGVFLLALAFQWPIYDRWLALQDEGYILAIADELNRGRVLYRDVTSDAPFPGAFYLVAWWFRLVGASIEHSRFLAIGGFALYSAAIFRISRELLSRGYALALVLLVLCYRVWAFPHWQIYSYSLVSAVFVTMAAALVCVYRRKGGLGFLVLAGLCAGGGIMSKQNYGLAVTGALGLALLIMPWLSPQGRPSWGKALGPGATLGLAALAVVAPCLAYFAYEGALPDMFEQTWVYPFTLMAERSFVGLPDLWPLFEQDSELRRHIGSYFPAILATLWWYPCSDCFVSDMSRGPLYQGTIFWDVTLKLIYWAPLFVFFLASVLWGKRIISRRMRGEPSGDSDRRLLLLAFAGGFLLAFNKPRDWVHLMMVYHPVLLLGCVLVSETLRTFPGRLRTFSSALLACVLAGTTLVSLALMWDLRRQIDWPLEMPRGGVYADRHNGPIIEEIFDYLARNSPASEPVPVYPVQPMIGFLAGRQTAGGYYVVWPSQSPGRDEKIIRDFEEKPISHVIYSLSQFEHLGAFQENAPDLFQYLVENFRIDRSFGDPTKGSLLLGLRREEHRGGAAPIPVATLPRREQKFPPHWRSWPFERAMTSGPSGIIRFGIEVPRYQPSLWFGYGINPERWLDVKGGPFQFQVDLQKTRLSRRETVFEAEIDPATNVLDRRWQIGEIDLTPFAGEMVFLTFTTQAQSADPKPEDLVGWREPVFLLPRNQRTVKSAAQVEGYRRGKTARSETPPSKGR